MSGSTPVDLNALFAAGFQSKSSPANPQQHQQLQPPQQPLQQFSQTQNQVQLPPNHPLSGPSSHQQSFAGTPVPGATPGAVFPGAQTPLPFSPHYFTPSPKAVPPPASHPDVLNHNGPSAPYTLGWPAPAPQATPPVQPQPRHSEASNELLNLLKRSATPAQHTQVPTPTAAVAPPPPQQHPSVVSPNQGFSAQDLLASLYGKPAAPAQATSGDAPVTNAPATSASVEPKPAVGASTASSDMLLKLLNIPKPTPTSGASSTAATSATSATAPAPAAAVVEKQQEDSKREEKEKETKEDSVPAESTAQTTQPVFTYVNPFDQLAAISAKEKKKTSVKGTPSTKAKDVSFGTPTQAVSPAVSAEQEKPGFKSPSPILKAKETNGQEPEVSSKPKDTSEKEDVKEDVQDVKATESKVDITAREIETETKPVREAVEREAEKKATDTAHAAVPEGGSRKAPSEVSGHWEPEHDHAVPVYNFPFKPFLTITWKGIDNPKAVPTIRPDSVLDIARLKKDFDQLDRQLISATSEFISYPSAKTGVRVIRQSDGADVHLFKFPVDRMTHVNLCSTSAVLAPTRTQNLIAIGVSGTTYWAPIMSESGQQDESPMNDEFNKVHIDNKTVVFPPYPEADGSPSSSGQNPLRTRAKRSSRHPEFFGIMRGRYVHIVFPYVALRTNKYLSEEGHRKLDTAKFYKEQCFKIPTGGKPGRDFAFSEDDSVVVTLDRSGRMRFWDITPVLDSLKDGALVGAMPESPACHLVMAAGTPGEKCSPASILLMDKLRPYVKGTPCRYALVGLKQNHVLQLFDITIGKAVQELVLPQDTDTDAICSVTYHPHSSMIIVGHPTRNVIYFITLSVPKYNLPPMSQATFCKRVAEKDPSLPKTETTAFMSCIRELSYDGRGELRSLDVVSVSPFPGEKKTAREEQGNKEPSQPVFEIYTMYNRGVNCIGITKEDLGLTNEEKIILPVDASTKGFLEFSEMAQPILAPTPEPSAETVQETSVPATPTPQGATNVSAKRDVPDMPAISEDLATKRVASPAKDRAKKKGTGSDTLSVEKPTEKQDGRSRRQRKKPAIPTPTGASTPVETPTSSAGSKANATAAAGPAINVDKSAHDDRSPLTALNFGVPSDLLNREAKRIEQLMAEEMAKQLKGQLDGLYTRFSEDRIAQDKASSAKQDVTLRQVQRSLSEDAQQSFARIVEENIRDKVMPNITATVGKIVEEKLKESMKNFLPATLQDPQITEAFSKHASISNANVAKALETQLPKAMQTAILPALRNEYVQATDRSIKDAERRFANAMKTMEQQRLQDSKKIDELSSLVRSLSQTVTMMASGQTEFQAELLELRRQLAASGAKAPATATAGPAPSRQHPPTAPSAQDIEIAEIDQLMKAGKFEEGSIRWLQSSQQANVFDRLFVNYNASYLSSLSPIVALSVGAAVTSSFETNAMQRLDWLQVAFKTIDPKDSDIRDVIPKIMETIIERLEDLRNRVKRTSPGDPILRRIPPLIMWAQDLRKNK